MKRLFLSALALPLLTASAVACPLCDSATGEQVRAGIFNDEFWPTLLAVLSPFPVLLAVLAVMHFGWPTFGRRSSASTPTPAQHQ